MKTGLKTLLRCGSLLMAVWIFPITSSLAGNLPLVVSVSVPPQAYLVERLGGERVEVHVLVPPGASPATYEPSPHQVVTLAKSSLYVAVGHPDFLFEQRHLERLLEASPGMPLVNMSAGTDASCLPEQGRDSEEDPHIWLSLGPMRSAAFDIEAALVRLDPAGTPRYRQNLEDLLADIDQLDLEIGELMAGKQGQTFMVFHPAWSHFACEYGLRQMAIEAGGKEPGPAHLVKTIEAARDEGIQVIFVQRGFSDRSARVIAEELGVRVESLDPLARDWLENLLFSAQRIASAIP
jgi:zinc transport system substrate-binding protein